MIGKDLLSTVLGSNNINISCCPGAVWLDWALTLTHYTVKPLVVVEVLYCEIAHLMLWHQSVMLPVKYSCFFIDGWLWNWNLQIRSYNYICSLLQCGMIVMWCYRTVFTYWKVSLIHAMKMRSSIKKLGGHMYRRRGESSPSNICRNKGEFMCLLLSAISQIQ